MEKHYTVVFFYWRGVCCGSRREAAFNVFGSSHVSQAGCRVLAWMVLWFHLHRERDHAPANLLYEAYQSCWKAPWLITVCGWNQVSHLRQRCLCIFVLLHKLGGNLERKRIRFEEKQLFKGFSLELLLKGEKNSIKTVDKWLCGLSSVKETLILGRDVATEFSCHYSKQSAQDFL